MNLSLTYLLGPKTVIEALKAAVFWFCVRPSSGQGRDVNIMEQSLGLTLGLMATVDFGFFAMAYSGVKR